jgi:hypothetical protein
MQILQAVPASASQVAEADIRAFGRAPYIPVQRRELQDQIVVRTGSR